MMKQRPILFITGLSGAGISTTLKVLEDCGYEVFDNFPLSHLPIVLNENGYEDKPIAFGLDTRTRGFDAGAIIESAKNNGGDIVFLTATNAVLQKRFSETRRVHPLAKDRTVVDGIIQERAMLDLLPGAATRVIDTSDQSVHDLKRLVEADFSLQPQGKRLAVTIMSFGFKYGVPRGADMVLDVRFIKNPHWEADLKPLTGEQKPVQDYIMQDENLEPFFTKIEDMVTWLLPRYAHEGKSYFTLAFGCTGGKHRSVYLAKRLSDVIGDQGYAVTVHHRDMPVT